MNESFDADVQNLLRTMIDKRFIHLGWRDDVIYLLKSLYRLVKKTYYLIII